MVGVLEVCRYFVMTQVYRLYRNTDSKWVHGGSNYVQSWGLATSLEGPRGATLRLVRKSLSPGAPNLRPTLASL